MGNKRILITGANGFIGSAIVHRMVAEGRAVRASMRQAVNNFPAAVDIILGKDLDPDTDWHTALAGVNVVVHCAARVHVMKEKASDPLAEFRRINEMGTLALARQASQCGVKRFIFLSTIGVNGGETFDKPFSAEDQPRPTLEYALAKYGAETGLRQLALETGMEVVIIRPPLVYGREAPGNFRQLVNAIQRHLPLPLGAIKNKRSFVALDNLVDLVVTCVDHPRAGNQTFLVSDNEDVSTAEFIRRIGKALGISPFLLPIPEFCLKALAKLAGKDQQLRKLTGSLQLDIGYTMNTLDWRPIISMDAALAAAVSPTLLQAKERA